MLGTGGNQGGDSVLPLFLTTRTYTSHQVLLLTQARRQEFDEHRQENAKTLPKLQDL